MSANSRLDIDTRPFVLEELPSAKREDDATILQDAGRVAVLEQFTLMAKIASTQKWTPLLAVDPDLTGANMVCGAIDGTLAEFAALSDGEFAISINGVAMDLEDLDFTGIDTVEDRAGYMTCGAIGGTLPEFAAVNDGEFGIDVDGTDMNITVDLSGLDAEDDVPGYYTCGTNGAIIAAGWDAIADGSATIPVNGVDIVLTGLDFTDALTFDDVAETFSYALAGRATCVYDANTNIFRFVSNTTGETSIVATLSTGGAGTDVAAAGYLNGTVAGTATAGTGGEGTAQTIPDLINAAALGRFFCYYTGDAFVFVSRSTGELSIVTVLTAGAGGTDISGAGFLNGTGGTPVAGVGGEGLMENIAEIINGAALGRFFVAFNGDAFVFTSSETGTDSIVTVLSAVAAGGGTDISGVGFLNGLVGTATAGTGGTGVDLPQGIYIGNEITAAALVAADVVDAPIIIFGVVVDEDKLVLEGGLDLDDVIGAGDPGARTIRDMLRTISIIPRSTRTTSLPGNA